MIESLGQAVKAAGFVVPGALGVSEGGMVVVAGLFGVPPAAAIALALIKRLREIAFGLPALAAWQWLGRNWPRLETLAPVPPPAHRRLDERAASLESALDDGGAA